MGELPLSKAELLALPGSYQTIFDLCHFLLAALAVRKEVGVEFTRSRPLATWLATLSASFAGSLVANPLLGKPVLGALSSEKNLLMATLMWWAVCYSPADIVKISSALGEPIDPFAPLERLCSSLALGG